MTTINKINLFIDHTSQEVNICCHFKLFIDLKLKVDD